MKTIISVFALSALAVSLFAQAPEKTADAPAAEKKPAAAGKAQPGVGKAPAAGQNSKKQAEEADDGTVMIDSKGEPDERGSVGQTAGEAAEPEVEVPGGLPSSYGQCKGVISDGGRSILVFENPDDGTVYFVQITLGRTGAAWKLVDRILRSAD
ncbi:MAG TPA: hypothetical protein PKI19_00785 [Elusimicrobiales bacterium]|nr:hypothetical protein [Elusimicrobiales bacterium]